MAGAGRTGRGALRNERSSNCIERDMFSGGKYYALFDSMPMDLIVYGRQCRSAERIKK